MVRDIKAELEVELAALEEKRIKLGKFMKTDAYDALPYTQVVLLGNQFGFMTNYAGCLSARIKDLQESSNE